MPIFIGAVLKQCALRQPFFILKVGGGVTSGFRMPVSIPLNDAAYTSY